jgi:drug/metabolite transporter (DMT)-like permease
MPPLLLALCSSVLVGTSDFTGGWSARRNSILLTLLISQATGVAGLIGVCALFGGHPSRADYLWACLAGFGLMGGRALLYSALAGGKMSAIAPVASVCAIIVPVLFDPVRLSPFAYLGIALAIAAVILIKRSEASDVQEQKKKFLPLLLGALAGACFGFFYVCMQHYHPNAGFWPVLAAQGVSFILTVFYAAVAQFKGVRIFSETKGWWIATLPGLAANAGSVCILLAMRGIASLSVVTTIDALYPVTTVFLALVILKEKLRPIQAIGLAAAALAIILIAGFAHAH